MVLQQGTLRIIVICFVLCVVGLHGAGLAYADPAQPEAGGATANTKTPSSTRVKPPTRTKPPTRIPTNTRTPTATPTFTPTMTPTATRVALTPVPSDMMGLVGRDPYFETTRGRINQLAMDEMGRHMAEIGVRWVRLDVRMATPLLAGNAAIDAAIRPYDYFIKTVAPRHGIKVLLLLNFDLLMGIDANAMATGPFVDNAVYGPGYNTYMQAWMRRAFRIIQRYGKGVSAIEVLNEANRLPQYSAGGPVGNAVPATAWAQLVTTLYQHCNETTLVKSCQGTPIILGGLHPRGTDAQGATPAQSDIDYLSDIYASPAFQAEYAKNGRWPVDGIGYHPYPVELAQIGVSSQTAAFNRLRARLELLNDPLRQVWVTEIGYNVGYASQTEAGQAAFLRTVYQTLAVRMLSNGVREIAVVFWFKYEDFPPATGVHAQKWGLVRIPFVDGSCPGGACYERSGLPSYYRLAWYYYRDIHQP